MPRKHFDEKRRSFLKVAGGSVLVGGLAGCMGGDGGDGGDGGGDGSDGDGGDGGGDGGDGGSEGYLTQDLRFVVPFGEGGGFDTYARLMAPYAEEYLGGSGTVIVENVTGGGGVVGLNEIWNRDANGFNIGWIHSIEHPIRQITTPDAVQYDVEAMSHVGITAQAAYSFMVPADSDLTFGDINDDPTAYNIGTPGAGTPGHLVPLLLWPDQADNLNFVHHDGSAAAATSLRRGDIDIYAAPITSGWDQVGKSGDAKFVVYFNNNPPTDIVPEDVPTLADEIGDRGEELSNQFTLSRVITGPEGIPDDKLQRLRDGYWQTMNDEGFLADAEEAGRPVAAQNGEDAAQMMDGIIALWEDALEQLPEGTV